MYLETLCRLTSRSFNPNCDKFLKIISCLPLTKIKQIGIGPHIDSAGLKRCKEFCFEFLYLLETANPRTNYNTLFTSTKSKATYEGWKARHKTTQNGCSEEPTLGFPDQAPELSAQKIFSQPLAREDLEAKQARFVAQSEDTLRAESESGRAVRVVCDIVNYDMAVLHTSVALSNDLVEAARLNAEAAPNTTDRSVCDSEVREKLRLAVHNNFDNKGLKPDPEQGETIVLQLFSDGQVEIRLNHKNTTYILKVKTSPEERKFWKRPGVIATFLFDSSIDQNSAPSEQTTSRVIEAEEVSQRKFSQDSAVCDFGWSNSSTVAGSESGQVQKPTEEVVCNISGELSFEVEYSKGGLAQGNVALNIHLFLSAKDKASTALVQELPNIKHLVNTAIVESFFMLALC